MPAHPIRRVAAAVCLAAGLWSAAPADVAAKDDLPDGLAKQLAAGDVAYIQKQLADPKLRKSAYKSIKAAAFMIAQYAQANMNGPGGDEWAALRGQALKVAEAFKTTAKADLAAAKKAAEGLGKPAPAADKGRLELHKLHDISLDEIMGQYRKATVGGRNIEAQLDEQAAKLTDPKLAAEIGGRSAAIADFSAVMVPESATGAKKGQWDNWVKQMKTLSVQIAAEGQKGAGADTAKLGKALQALQKNCKDCHEVFRNN